MNQNQTSTSKKSFSLPISFRAPINEAYALDNWCRENSINRSSLLRSLVNAYLPPKPDETVT